MIAFFSTSEFFLCVHCEKESGRLLTQSRLIHIKHAAAAEPLFAAFPSLLSSQRDHSGRRCKKDVPRNRNKQINTGMHTHIIMYKQQTRGCMHVSENIDTVAEKSMLTGPERDIFSPLFFFFFFFFAKTHTILPSKEL